MAEQSTSQQDEQRLVDIILANVGTVVCFRSGSPSDERLVLPLFMPFIQQGEIANLPSYSYYVRISAVTAQEPMSGVTVVVEEQGDESIARRVIELSRELYAKKIKEARENIKVQGRSIPKAPTTKKTGRQEEDDLLSAISVS